MLIHIVKSGETLSSIAAAYGLSDVLLANGNGISSLAALAVGQTLVVRFPRTVHLVQRGETLYSIAARYGVSVRRIYQNNFSLGGNSTISPGDLLVIEFMDQPSRSIRTNAYAYSNINRDLLTSALPYLSYLTPFTYGISASGQLFPLNDRSMLAAAGNMRCATLMHLSSLTEDGVFSNERSSLILNSVVKQDALIESVLATMREKNYYGLDVDFEFVPPQEREAYAAFIQRLVDRLNPLGYPVIVALAPKTSAQQRGLLYEAHDYAVLGRIANAVLLMTYEWGYTYGPPMAVAPLPQVRSVLDYAVSVIDSGKIYLGVPTYGYDWKLPFEAGITKAESISPQYAIELALANKIAIQYDSLAQAPYFHYTDRDGAVHVVWFEDARSCQARFRLIEEYGLRGAGFWNLMRNFPQNWAVLNAMYQIETIL